MRLSLSWTDPAALAGLAARLQGRGGAAPVATPARVRFPSTPSTPPTPSAAAHLAHGDVPAPPPLGPPPPLGAPPMLAPPRVVSGAVPGATGVVPAPPTLPPMPAAPGPAMPAATAKPAVRSTSGPTTNSSASWQRPSFRSVEIDAAAIGLDPAALRRAAAARKAPADKPAAPAKANATTPKLVPVPPPPPPRSIGAQISEPDDEGELSPLTGGRVSPSVSLSSILQGTFAEKLEVFVHWLMGSTGAYAAFVVDDEGLEVANRHATEDLLAVSALIDRALVESRRVLLGTNEGSFALELDERNVLQLVWVDADHIRFGIGLVLADALEGRLIKAIRKSFHSVAAIPGAKPRSA